MTDQQMRESFRLPDVDDLAQFIRMIDGANTMGAGILAEHICVWLANQAASPRESKLAEALRQLSEMKARAQRAHAICNEMRIQYPDIVELGDDGPLHDAIHDILRVDTPMAQLAAHAREGERAEPMVKVAVGAGTLPVNDAVRRMRELATQSDLRQRLLETGCDGKTDCHNGAVADLLRAGANALELLASQPRTEQAAQGHSVDGCLIVPARISEADADIIGMPVAWYERAVATAARLRNPSLYAAPQPRESGS